MFDFHLPLSPFTGPFLQSAPHDLQSTTMVGFGLLAASNVSFWFLRNESPGPLISIAWPPIIPSGKPMRKPAARSALKNNHLPPAAANIAPMAKQLATGPPTPVAPPACLASSLT